MGQSTYDRHLSENGTALRQRNAKVQDVSDGSADLDASDTIAPFLCECAKERCTETIDIDFHEYEAIHRSRTSFIASPGHETSSIEDVVLQQPNYYVVEKHND